MNHRIYLFTFVILFMASAALAQPGKIPPFRIQQANGKVFKAEDLPIGKPVIIIYFSPDCSHCDQLMTALLKHHAGFKNASIAMITHLSITKVFAFNNKYHLSNYPNIFTGSEGTTLFVKKYYHIDTMPFIALHTKNGDMVKTYTNEAALDDLSARLAQIK